jgi:Thiolase, C-terminal domain
LHAVGQKNPDDVVITLAVRTPLTKAPQGGLRDTTLEHIYIKYTITQTCDSYSGCPWRIENQTRSSSGYRFKIGPAYAIPKLLETLGLRKEDIDVFEINEVFATMLAYCIETLRLDHKKVNVKSGAIALGYPLGASKC